MEINYLDRFNPDTMVLGSLCIRGHNHKAGQSIRYSPKNNKLGACIQCKYEYHHGIISKFEYPKNPPNILNIDYNKIMKPDIHVFGILCEKNHDHRGGQSIRYKRKDSHAGSCLQCHMERMHSEEHKAMMKERDARPDVKQRKLEHSQKPESKKKDAEYKRKQREDPILREKHRAWRKAYRAKPEVAEKRKKGSIEYNQRPEVKERKRIFQNKKYTDDPAFRLNSYISSIIGRSLRGGKKGQHWEDLVDFTLDTYLTHLSKQLKKDETIDCIGKVYEVDHIIPKSFFIFKEHTDEQFKLCWDLENLQLLSKFDNIKKLNRYAGSPQNIIMTKNQFKNEILNRPIQEVCEEIWRNYYDTILRKYDKK